MSTRKRARPSSPQEDDELSPKNADISTSTKKRKLNTYGSTRKGGLSNLKQLVTGFLGWNDKEKDVDGSVDELAEDDEQNEMGKGKGKGGRGKVKDVFDLPSSGDEEQVVVKPRKKPAAKKETPKPGRRGEAKKRVDIWDVPVSDEEEVGRKVVRGSAKGKKVGSQKKLIGKKFLSGDTVEEEKPKSTRKASGRGEKSSPSPETEAEIEQAELPKSSGREFGRGRKAFDLPRAEKVEEEAPVSSKKKTGRGKKVSIPVPELQDEDVEPPKSSGRKGGRPKKATSPIPDPTPRPAQSIPKKRGRPRKNLDGIIQDAKGTPKGILTPSKGRTLKSKKSVAFDRQDDIDLGFKDIPITASVKKPKKVQKIVEKVEEEDSEPDNDDDCGVCSRSEEQKGNEMILCDGCEFSVHLKCYNLDSIPKGKWFCKNCKPEDYTDEGEIEEPELVQDDEEDGAEEEDEGTLEVTKPAPTKNRGEEEETSCAICAGLESKLGNKIILCDSCDFAVHVKCYNLPTFPKGDWFCRTCLAAAGEDPFNLGIEDETALNEPESDLPNIAGLETHLRRAQRVVLDQLTGQKPIKLCGHDEEMQKVQQVVEQTILAGEGNSMLVIGARGCGKTTLVESVISNLSADHKDSFHVVRLNGFIHTDDKIASKEIWRQLGKEMDVEDDGAGKPSNYADTLASLLALLSHPSENSQADVDQTAKSVIFILDEFDLFTGHSRQTLLYNLFDIAQARKAPIVVLGLTTRVDVVESLEKRVKSRFSHRYVHLSLPRSIPAFWEICKQGLTIDEEFEGAGSSEFSSYWSGMVDDLYTKDPAFKQHLLAHFFRSKSMPAFYTSLLLPLTLLTPRSLPLTGKNLSFSPNHHVIPLAPPDSKLHLLQGLSELSLALLISAARLDIILDTDTCNFAMAYDEYSSLTSRHKIQVSSTGVNALGSSAKVWGREVALGCWEGLGEVGLLVSAGGNGGGGGGGAGGRMWKVDVGLEEIAGSVVGLSAVMGKWCREI